MEDDLMQAKPEDAPESGGPPIEGDMPTEAIDTQGSTPESPNNESIELINRFAPGSDTSTPEGIIEGQLTVLKSMVPIYDKLYDLARTSPESAAFISDLLDTGSPVKALVRNFDSEEIQTALDEAESSDYEEDKNMFSEKVTGMKARNEELEKNKKESEISAQAFMDKYQPNDDDVTGFVSFYDKLLSDAVNNKMTVEHWESVWQAYKYKDDVSEAESNGMVMGRNEKIVTQKAGKKDLDALLPEANAGMGMAPKTEKPKSYKEKFLEGVV